MNYPKGPMLTPLYVKSQPDFAWPDDPVFYLITRDGLFLCRNHPFFASCVPAPRWPSELARHDPYLLPRYPKMPRQQVEEIVGFFAEVGTLHGAEAAALVAWNRSSQTTHIIIPDQIATVSRNYWGDTFPIGVEYDPPNLSTDLQIIGDIHSHVDMEAYSSYVDKQDEAHRTGIHIVVGRISREPPDFHIEGVVDGTRFQLKPADVFEDYQRRRFRFDPAWMGKIRVNLTGSGAQGSGHQSKRYEEGNKRYEAQDADRDEKALDARQTPPGKPHQDSLDAGG